MTAAAPVQLNRRRFLRGAGAASAAAGAMAELTTPESAQAYDPGQDERRARYRESEDVKAFYRTNGYETLKK
jgi:hypothetical protein